MIRRLTALAISLGLRAFDIVREKVRRRLDRPRRPSGVVLYYHAIKPSERSSFARQMDELLKRARPFPAGSPEAISGEGRNVAITFDDGFESVVENAVPELEKRSIPFTMFVPTGCLGERPSWVPDPRHRSWQERVLSATHLRALARAPLATVGSHSITHRNLLELDLPHAEQELVGSRADLQAAVGVDIDLFSFPHGAHSAVLVDKARQAGYRLVFTIEPTLVEPDTNLFAVGRIGVDPTDWPVEFRLKIAGAYRWRHYLHRLRRVV